MTRRDIEKVRRRHEAALLAVDGVEGVGIGALHGRPAIKVYVAEASKAQRRRIPSRVEDVPVVIEESGSFEAY